MREHEDGGIRPEAVLAVLVILSVLMMLFSRDFGRGLLTGIQRLTGSATVRMQDSVASLRRFREMRVQYESSIQKLSNYQGLEREVIELRRENKVLKNQLGMAEDLTYEHLAVRVIAQDPSNIFSSLTIDRGTADGIAAGDVVTAFQDGFFGLLGKVVSTGRQTSLVRPLTAPSHFVAGRLLESRYSGLVEGRGDGELIMRYVRKSAGPSANDLVVTSGMESLYPPDIVIGRVREVRYHEYAPSKELILIPVIDTGKIEYAFVLRSRPE